MKTSGFVDLQVNGYRGINFSDPELTLEQVGEAAGALAGRGTIAFCPTLITSPLEAYSKVLPVLARAIREQPRADCRILGIHLEGPFISPEDGAVGAHPVQYVQTPSLPLLEELFELADGQVSLLTVAPERPGAAALIRRAVELGMTVSVGHTLADAAAVRAAVQAGARLSTHLGNGCPNLIHRHLNPIWPQLAARDLGAMIITDGHHLPAEVIAAFIAAKGVENVIVTSDSSPAAGLPPGEYAFFGTHALLEPSGRLRNLERDTLAGSSAAMVDCMNFLAGIDLLSEDELWQVGRDQPLKALGVKAELPPGRVSYEEKRFKAG